MTKIPDFILRALYVKGSLRNIEEGFEFKILNQLGPVRIVGARPLTVDRRPIPPDKCSFIHGETRATFPEVSEDNSVLLRKGDQITVRAAETSLKPGRRVLGIDILVKDMGQVRFTVTDSVK